MEELSGVDALSSGGLHQAGKDAVGFQPTIRSGVNGKVKVYQFWENESVPPLGSERELRRGQLA